MKSKLMLGVALFGLAGYSQAQELALPPKFEAKLIADNLGKTRHLFITPSNDIYVRLAKVENGGGTLFLNQENGKAVEKQRFGTFSGTGVAIDNGYLYTTSNSEVYRYKLNGNYEVIDPANPEKVVDGLVDQGTHATKSIVADGKGNLFIPIGAPSNACQEKDRQKDSPGMPNCPLLEETGGVWKFRADQLNQTYADGQRYATGLRNVVGSDLNPATGELFAMQHGRDQLSALYPEYFTTKQSAELPAECLFELKEGANAGWPYIYYDGFQQKNILAPEYGGDGVMEGPAEYIKPAVAFPAHMAPNDLLFYTGDMFPEKYKNGAFIAFHGSWNRAPEPQAGYFVVFQPFKNGKPSGDWEVFADGFSGSQANTESGRAERRPCGLAQGPDGALYICDDTKGGIFKITYNPNGPANAPAKTGKMLTKEISSSKPKTPASIDAKAQNMGQLVYKQNCATCHQADGLGVGNLNPPLANTDYVLGDDKRLIDVVLKGLSQKPVNGKEYSNVMPAFPYLSDKEVSEVLTYIRSSFGNQAKAISEKQVKNQRKK
ncbi:PQQ-dependent sugar dehydrogenase [Marinilongibacter aquaticus]|uniref:PQQ-dependent sugar dehydrogenase n=1 Tax=Marinilongibacter aquaticus TaxID=2975157 RepID=UPI0021BD9803|nr:PQQ-dependent sugar dehydrogenase [Marinilongibacter aquaticus]UBM59610.1 PQQ-dependent sugar dehydrogenase [Marinilongibacter aquaticus]